MTAAEAEGRARRIAGEEREVRLDGERRRESAKRLEAREAWEWVCARFPVEKRSQACVALLMLRWIRGPGKVTRGMVEARMRAQDERYGLNDGQPASEQRGSAA